MSEALDFKPIDIMLIETHARRGKKVKHDQIASDVSYNVVSATYNAGSNKVQVVTHYDVTLSKEGGDDPDEDFVAALESKFVATFQLSRPVEEEEVEQGILEPVLMAADRLSHPYHRQTMADSSRSLGVRAFELPLLFDDVESIAQEQVEAPAS